VELRKDLSVFAVGTVAFALATALIANGGHEAWAAKTVSSTILRKATLKPPRRNPSNARGSALVIRQKGQIGLLIKARKMPKSVSGKPFAVWLYTKPSRKRFLGFLRAVVTKEGGKLESISRLSGSYRYRHILITRESEEVPTRPGLTIIRGRLKRPN
jgi:hypothetical protein